MLVVGIIGFVIIHLKCHRRVMVLSNENVTDGTMPEQRRMNKQARLELVRSYREEYMSAGRGVDGRFSPVYKGAQTTITSTSSVCCAASTSITLGASCSKAPTHAYCAARSMPRLSGSFISPMLPQASPKMSMIP